jgi:hypothetical protein
MLFMRAKNIPACPTAHKNAKTTKAKFIFARKSSGIASLNHQHEFRVCVRIQANWAVILGALLLAIRFIFISVEIRTAPLAGTSCSLRGLIFTPTRWMWMLSRQNDAWLMR